MTEPIVGIPGKYSCCWTLSRDNHFAGSNIPTFCLDKEVMKPDSKMAEHVFDDCHTQQTKSKYKTQTTIKKIDVESIFS